MKYGLEIVQKTEQGEQIVAVDALGEVGEGEVYLKYGYDDADYELIIKDGQMSQSRKGDVCIFTQFVCGRQTVCTIEDGANSGAFMVYTQRLDVSFTENGFTAQCVYADGEGGKPTELYVKAYILQQQ